MPVKKLKGSSKKSGCCRLAIEGELTMATISQEHAAMLLFYSEYKDFEIELSAVEEIDCSGIQLLLALQQTALGESRRLLLKSASKAVSEAMKILNVSDRFEWAELPGAGA